MTHVTTGRGDVTFVLGPHIDDMVLLIHDHFSHHRTSQPRPRPRRRAPTHPRPTTDRRRAIRELRDLAQGQSEPMRQALTRLRNDQPSGRSAEPLT